MNRLNLIWRYIIRNWTLAIGLGILLFLILFSVIGSYYIDPKNAEPLSSPARVAPTLSYCPPANPDCEPTSHPFGTDSQGRDLFAVAITGTWLTLRIGLLAGVIGILIGTFLGFTSAFYGGWYDAIIRWMVDVLLTVPGLMILIVIATTLGAKAVGLTEMALIISVISWRGPARVIRSQVLTMRERPYVMMARLNGMSSVGIIIRELIPNLLPYLGASLVGAVTGAIYASIGLFGLGLGPLNEPTLGATIYLMMNQGAFVQGLWWWVTVPVTIIALVFVMLFMISIGLDEVANPRVRRSA